jgi:hypothetical protein
MRATRPGRKEDAVARPKFSFSIRGTKRRPPGYDDEQLVVAEFVVVREGALARRKLVEAGAEMLAGNALSPPPKARLLRGPCPLYPASVVEQVGLHAQRLVALVLMVRRSRPSEGHFPHTGACEIRSARWPTSNGGVEK